MYLQRSKITAFPIFNCAKIKTSRAEVETASLVRTEGERETLFLYVYIRKRSILLVVVTIFTCRMTTTPETNCARREVGRAACNIRAKLLSMRAPPFYRRFSRDCMFRVHRNVRTLSVRRRAQKQRADSPWNN